MANRAQGAREAAELSPWTEPHRHAAAARSRPDEEWRAHLRRAAPSQARTRPSWNHLREDIASLRAAASDDEAFLVGSGGWGDRRPDAGVRARALRSPVEALVLPSVGGDSISSSASGRVGRCGGARRPAPPRRSLPALFGIRSTRSPPPRSTAQHRLLHASLHRRLLRGTLERTGRFGWPPLPPPRSW